MPDNLMPRVYRWLLTLSGITLLVVGWADGRGPFWGVLEQVVMVIAGVLVIWSAWKPFNRPVGRVAAYVTAIGGGFEVVNHVNSYVTTGGRYFFAAAIVWVAFITYTVALLAFGWVSQGPQE